MGKTKFNEPGRPERQKRETWNSWQWMKHAKDHALNYSRLCLGHRNTFPVERMILNLV